MRMRGSMRVMVTALAAACVLNTATAAWGATYEVSYAAADGSGWSPSASGGFAVDGWRVTAAGPAGGGNGEIVLRTGTPDLRIASARLTARVDIGASGVIGRGVALDGGSGTTTAVVGGSGTHLLEVDRPGDGLAIGLFASGPVGAGAATLQLLGAAVVFDDLRAPRISTATGLQDGACTRVTVAASDAESGIASITLRDRRSLTSLAAWSAPAGQGMQPGAGTVTWQPCVAIGSLAGGLRSVDVDVVDIAGQHTFSAIVDAGGAAAPGPPAVSAPSAAATGSGTLVLSLGRVPVAVTYGSRLPVRITLARSGVPVAARVVHLRDADGATIAQARTSAIGSATLTATAASAGPFTVVVPGSSAIVRVPTRVSPRVTWSASPTRVGLGNVVRLRGQVQPAAACRAVTLQAQRGSGWFVVRRGATCDARGSFAIPVTANARGAFRLRAQVAPRGAWRAGQSAARVLRVD